jgi:hypothetical protein
MGDGFIVKDLDGTEFEKTPEGLREMIEQTGLQDDEFMSAFKVVPTKLKLYKINHLVNVDPEVIVESVISPDYENDKQYQSNLALLLNARGIMGKVDTAKKTGVTDPIGTVKRAEAEQQVFEIAKAIATNPQLMAEFQARIMGAQQQEQKPPNKQPEGKAA